MKKTIYFVAPFLLMLGGCTSSIPAPMISTLVLFYNIGLLVGYLLMASTVLPIKNKGTLLLSGFALVTAILINLYLMNAYYNQNYFEISLPYFWLIK